jgi:hypothetical protein
MWGKGLNGRGPLTALGQTPMFFGSPDLWPVLLEDQLTFDHFPTSKHNPGLENS